MPASTTERCRPISDSDVLFTTGVVPGGDQGQLAAVDLNRAVVASPTSNVSPSSATSIACCSDPKAGRCGRSDAHHTLAGLRASAASTAKAQPSTTFVQALEWIMEAPSAAPCHPAPRR
jgi:hypothetical protein